MQTTVLRFEVSKFKTKVSHPLVGFESGLPNAFKIALLNTMADDKWMIALYLQELAHDKNLYVQHYSSIGELPSGGNYRRGGRRLSGFYVGLFDNTAFVDFDDAVWAEADFTADAAVIYNASRENVVAAVLDFEQATAANGGNFVIEMPPRGPRAIISLR